MVRQLKMVVGLRAELGLGQACFTIDVEPPFVVHRFVTIELLGCSICVWVLASSLFPALRLLGIIPIVANGFPLSGLMPGPGCMSGLLQQWLHVSPLCLKLVLMFEWYRLPNWVMAVVRCLGLTLSCGVSLVSEVVPITTLVPVTVPAVCGLSVQECRQ